MPHIPGHEDSPYGDLFELPEVGQLGPYTSSEYFATDINWSNPSSQDMARIMQDEELQQVYLEKLMEGGEYFGDDSTYLQTGYEGSPEKSLYDQARSDLDIFLNDERGIAEFLNLSPEEIREQVAARNPYQMGEMSEDEYENYLGWFTDMQEGFRRLQGGDFGIESLQRELGLAERGVTGPGGLTQQKGSMADMLQQKIGTRRQSYVPQEKTSRYGQVTGTGGGVDPTQSYLSGVEGDVSAYGTSIAGVDKSIYDILYGTEAGSIHDIYGQYGEGVKGSLFDGGDLWYT